MSDSNGRELWGRKFDVAEEGLDEGQVTEFVDELIQERDTLLEQRDSLLSYVRLSKKIVGMENEQTGSSRQQAENMAARTVTEVGQGIQPKVETTELEQTTPVLPEATEIAGAGKEETALYQGEVELAILPPVDAAQLLQFERSLRNSFELEILSTDGSPSKGSLIIALLTEPQPLLRGLKQMPEVEELDTSAQAEGILPSRFRNKPGRRIWVTLNKG